MTRKEIMDLLLSKVPEEKKDAFVAEIRGAGTKEERNEVLKKYGAVLTAEEAAAVQKDANELQDEELDLTSGGCTCACGCGFDG